MPMFACSTLFSFDVTDLTMQMLKGVAGEYMGNSGATSGGGGTDWSQLANLGNHMANHEQQSEGGSDLSSFTNM